MLGAIIVLASVVGRVGFNNSIAGDFEIMQMLAAMAVFSFLPLLMLQQGNVAVTIISECLPKTYKVALDKLAVALLVMLLAILTTYGSVGAYEAMVYQEKSQILGLPLWVAMAYGCFCMGVSCFACGIHLLAKPNAAIDTTNTTESAGEE
ncbi:MAG: TRAP transporter small permease [Candidatus Portiera sp.]|nr:TRAP transporter small permease [Portiera sp.]